MTPRESLASLLAVPYWALALIVSIPGTGSIVIASGLHGWARFGLQFVLGVALGAVITAAQGPVLDRLAGWLWARVEILAQEWRELSAIVPDIPLTSRNTPDIEAQQ